MIRIFLESLEGVFSWLVQATWQASVLVALVLIVQRFFRSRLNSRWTHALWLLVVARLLLPALPESALSLFQFAPPPPPAIVQSVTEPIFAPVISAFANDLPAPPPTVARPYPFSVWTLLALIWLTGALGLLVVTWQVNRRFGRHVRNAPPIDDPVLLQIASAAQAELDLHRSLRLIESAYVQGPAIMGLIHPTLILPQNVRAKFNESELRFIFLHEFAHLKRGDLILQWLVAILQILHWFNPVLWYAFRRMRADREPATDALVLSRTGEVEKYGHVLIKLLEHYHQRHALPTLVGILEDKDQFKRRFTLISQFTRGAYGWSLLAVVIFGTLAAVGLTAAHEKVNDQASGETPEEKAFDHASNDIRLDGIRDLPLDQFCAQIPALLRKNDPRHLATVKINVTKFGDEPWTNISAKNIPTTNLDYLLYRLKLIYPINYRVRADHIDVWQLSKAEVAFHEKAKATKIDVDFNGVNASTALKIIADASAAKGFAFPMTHLDELQKSEAQEANPITLHVKQIDVEAALRAVCYLGTLAGKPTQQAIGFEVSREDIGAAKSATMLRTQFEVIDYDPADTASAAQLLAKISGYIDRTHRLDGGSITGPAYPWIHHGKTYQPGTSWAWGMQPMGARYAGHMTSSHTKVIDKTQIQIDGTIDIQGTDRKSLGKISGQWTQPSGAVVHLLAAGQPMVVTLPDANHTRKALTILAEATLVDEDGNALLPFPDKIQDVSLAQGGSADAGSGSGNSTTGKDTADEAAFNRILERDRRRGADSHVKSSTFQADAQMLLAIQKGDVPALKKVLEHGVDPNTFDPDRFSSSPAYWAVYFDQPECLKLLLDHFAKTYDGPTHRGDQSAVKLAQKTHPDLVPILLEANKRNRATLTAQLTGQLHSIRIDVPAFSGTPLSQINQFLLDATSKAGYLERRVTVGSLDLPPSTTITSPSSSNVTLWDALQIITSKNNLRFDVDDQGVGEITLYPPQAEAIIQAQKPDAVEGPAATKPQSMTVSTPVPQGLILTGYVTSPSLPSRINAATDSTPAATFTDDRIDLGKPEQFSLNKPLPNRHEWAEKYEHSPLPSRISMAIGSDDSEAVKTLLDQGATFDANDMQMALRDGRKGIVRLLWEHGLPHYCSELAYAISQDEPLPKIKELLAKGSPVSSPEDVLITPLGLAAQRGDIGIAQILLIHGATLSPVDPALNPLDSAAGVGKKPAMVAFLLNSGAKATRRTLVNTIAWGTAPGPRPDDASTKIMGQLIRAGALKGIPEGESALLLILACQKQNPAILAELLQAGLNPLSHTDSAIGNGPTALDVIRSEHTGLNGSGEAPLLDMMEKAAAGRTKTTMASPLPSPAGPASATPSVQSSEFPWKTSITTTVFWTLQPGFVPDSSNQAGGFSFFVNGVIMTGAPVSQTASTINPFYVALPFNDLKYPDLARRWLPSAWQTHATQNDHQSECEGRWIEIKDDLGHHCYAQWEDAGPVVENDASYVFGTAKPAVTRAGLDVSPAVAQYLGFTSKAVFSWRFVESVPPGPWLRFQNLRRRNLPRPIPTGPGHGT